MISVRAVLFRTQRQLDDSAKDIEVLRAGGVAHELLDRRGCIRAEPGLMTAGGKFLGGLRLPNDETGDCQKFTTALATWLTTSGVTFRYSTNVQCLMVSGAKVTALKTDAGPIVADLYLVALASFSPRLLQPLGIRLPIYPVKGYSITAQIIDPSRAPVSTLLDETYKIAITRLGDRVRVGGMAEISGFGLDLSTRRRDTLVHCANELFPGAADLAKPSFWSGLRPMTPDGPPIIGRTPISNLFLNTGHGTLGWTMACGSGHVIASIMSDRSPAIDPVGLSIDRYR
jgi:D-amino-acid dehydrogenase